MITKIKNLLFALLLLLALKPVTVSAFYDPELGRFIQPDTIIPNVFNPQCLNRYAYAANNPLKYIDPSGHDNFAVGGENAPASVIITMTPQKRWVIPPPILTAPGSFATAGNPYQVATGGYSMSVRDAGPDALYMMQMVGVRAGVEASMFLAPGGAMRAGGWMMRTFRAARAAEETAVVADAVRLQEKYLFENKVYMSFKTTEGNVGVAGELVPSGTQLHLKDIAVYPEGVDKLRIGVKQVSQIRDAIAAEARQEGYKSLRITGDRFSGANYGKKVDVTIKLNSD